MGKSISDLMRLVGAVGSIAVGLATPVRAQQWELVSPPPAGSTRQLDFESVRSRNATQNLLQWSVLTPAPPSSSVTQETASTDAPSSAVNDLGWTTLTAEEVKVQQLAAEKALAEAEKLRENRTIVYPPSGPTYANYRALWRDGDWLPQISNIVPIGYGPKGVMLSLVLQGTDCHLGKGPCEPFTTYSAWQESLSTQANGEFFQALGFGDPIKAVSFIITNSLERLPAAAKSGSLDDSPLQGAQTGLHLAKAFGPDTSLRVGVENLITWNPNDYIYADMVRNFYAVTSQRIRLKSTIQPNSWFNNLYVTAGVGNGDFKPIEKIFQDQTAALRSAGCATYGYTPPTPCSEETFKRALKSGSDYGQLYPIGSAALEVVSGLHLIAEWTGRNLNAGLSWRPIPELGLIITPMFNSLIQNCEYPGCQVYVPGYNERVPLPSSVLTERARLSLQVSLEVKF
jgi:hypothetical protein